MLGFSIFGNGKINKLHILQSSSLFKATYLILYNYKYSSFLCGNLFNAYAVKNI